MGTSKPGNNSPALHHFEGQGYEIHFQDGPIKEFGVNGTTNEAVIQLLVDRISSLNEMYNHKYACDENDPALIHLGAALYHLEARTKEREARSVEGTSTP